MSVAYFKEPCQLSTNGHFYTPKNINSYSKKKSGGLTSYKHSHLLHWYYRKKDRCTFNL